MGQIVTRTKIVRPQPIDAYMISLNAFDTANSVAQYPSQTNLSSDPFYRLYVWGNLRYRKNNAAAVQEFQVLMRGSNVDVELWTRYFAALDVTPTNIFPVEWSTDNQRVSMGNVIPTQIFPPGMALAASCVNACNPSDIVLDCLMFESLNPDELRSLL